jgi:hypothetical protein
MQHGKEMPLVVVAAVALVTAVTGCVLRALHTPHRVL